MRGVTTADMDDLTAFLAGDRLDDVAIYVADTVVDTDHPLSTAGIAVDGGVVVVVAGETGREAFADSTGLDPMAFAKQAMDRTGEIDDRLAGGVCPAAADDPTASHHIEFGFAFAEAENEESAGFTPRAT